MVSGPLDALELPPVTWLGAGLGLGVLLICLALSVTLGAANISVGTVFDALFRFDAASFEHLVIRTVRLPRVLAGALVGAAVALLLAPKTGSEMRTRIKDMAAKAKEKVSRAPKTFGEATDAARDAFVATLDRS